MGFSLQQNRKYTESGDPGPDRDAQFRYINNKCSEFMKAGQPVISVDAKKKELIGNYKNAGAEYAPVKNPKKFWITTFRQAIKQRRMAFTISDAMKDS